MTLFYSITFSDCPIIHHGDIIYPISAYQNTEPYIESMKAFCNSALQTSLKKWGFTSDDMIKTEYYFYRNSEEIIFFRWEKENKSDVPIMDSREAIQ